MKTAKQNQTPSVWKSITLVSACAFIAISASATPVTTWIEYDGTDLAWILDFDLTDSSVRSYDYIVTAGNDNHDTVVANNFPDDAGFFLTDYTVGSYSMRGGDLNNIANTETHTALFGLFQLLDQGTGLTGSLETDGLATGVDLQFGGDTANAWGYFDWETDGTYLKAVITAENVSQALAGDIQTQLQTVVTGNEFIAVPEPATLGLVAVFSLGTLAVRRFFMM